MTTDQTAPPSTPAGAALARRMRLFIVLLIAMVVVFELPLPFRLAALAFGAGTMWIGVLVLIDLARLRRQGRRSRGQLAVSVGLGLTAVMLFALLSQAAFYPLVADYERCLGAAQTNTARKICDDANQQRREDIIDRLRPPTP